MTVEFGTIFRKKTVRNLLGCAVTVTIMCAPNIGATSPAESNPQPDDMALAPVYSPYAHRNYPDQVLFGDMHVHTNLSPDAGLIGTTLTVEESYRAARGETVMTNSGQPFQLIRPLDFMVVTDHAEYIGLAPMIREANPVLLADPHGKWLWENFTSGQEGP